MESQTNLLEQRRFKLAELKRLGYDPYPHKFEYTHTIGQLRTKLRLGQRRRTPGEKRIRAHLRPHRFSAPSRESRIYGPFRRRAPVPGVCAPGFRRARKFRAVSAVRSRRYHRGGRDRIPHAHGRAYDLRNPGLPPGQEPAALAGKMARAHGCGDTVPAEICGSYRESGRPLGFRQAQQDHPRNPQLSG